MSRPADEETVVIWWRRWPEANVGVVTGEVSGLAVIDVDPRHEGNETLIRLETAHSALPETLESRTGGGGRHLWFRLSGSDVGSAELGDGVELKADRGLIVAPPSVHASGTRYEWLDPRHELAPLPDWVRGLATIPEHREPGPREQVARTDLEREQFAVTWLLAGVEIHPGDAYYLCPFHDDHHPSLHIDAEGCRWYCFACRIGGGIGRLSRELGLPPTHPTRSRIRGRVGEGVMVTIEGDEPVAVVGESFHQDELLRLTGGQRSYGGVELEAVADLVPGADGGVEVQIDGRPVGYLASSDASRYEESISEAIRQEGLASCRAAIKGGWDRGGDDVGLFGVTLLLPALADD